MPTPNRHTVKNIEKLTRQFDDDMLLSLLDDDSDTDSNRTDNLTALQQKLSEELAQQQDYQRVQAELQDTVLSLADYLNAVQLVVTETFAHSVWVKAEIRSLSTKGGHYYFELADKDDSGKITASCRGNLWRGQATKLLKKFEQNTGMALDKGLNVMLNVTASFHPQYGFAVTILDIDPTYTLGDLAQQYHLDILIEYANQQLAQLSQRYTLKRLDNSLSLAIIDHDMDGETRSVASLSGGESFLTALALSLAIANMASGSMKIESLFIDEGFGTLDASSLHMVMNALDQLQSQGRKVILISHIQEMHERIPVQIQVQPMGSGSSRIEVVG